MPLAAAQLFGPFNNINLNSPGNPSGLFNNHPKNNVIKQESHKSEIISPQSFLMQCVISSAAKPAIVSTQPRDTGTYSENNLRNSRNIVTHSKESIFNISCRYR
jgi:hypothetical protein